MCQESAPSPSPQPVSFSQTLCLKVRPCQHWLCKHSLSCIHLRTTAEGSGALTGLCMYGNSGVWVLLLHGPASALSLMTGLQCRQGQLLLGLLTAPIYEVTPTHLAEWLCCAHVASFSFSWATAGLLASNGRSMQSGVRSVNPIRDLLTRARETRSGVLCVWRGEEEERGENGDRMPLMLQEACVSPAANRQHCAWDSHRPVSVVINARLGFGTEGTVRCRPCPQAAASH